MKLRRRLITKKSRKLLEDESFEARKQMEMNAQKRLEARLKAIEVRFLNEIRRGQFPST